MWRITSRTQYLQSEQSLKINGNVGQYILQSEQSPKINGNVGQLLPRSEVSAESSL